MYFNDLAPQFTSRKQFITGATFFLSSGVAVTITAKTIWFIPAILALVAAVVTAYSIAIGLDGLVMRMTRLHYEWNEIHSDYERLWNHFYDEDAENIYSDLLLRSRKASEIGTEAPYDEGRIEKWQERVERQYGVAQLA